MSPNYRKLQPASQRPGASWGPRPAHQPRGRLTTERDRGRGTWLTSRAWNSRGNTSQTRGPLYFTFPPVNWALSLACQGTWPGLHASPSIQSMPLPPCGWTGPKLCTRGTVAENQLRMLPFRGAALRRASQCFPASGVSPLLLSRACLPFSEPLPHRKIYSFGDRPPHTA